MKNNDLGLYKQITIVAREMEKYIVNFKHEYKYSYGAMLRQNGVELIKLVCMANTSTVLKERLNFINNAIGTFETYKFMLRMANFNKCLSIKQTAHIEELIGSVGNQLGGWKRSTEKLIPDEVQIEMDKDFEMQINDSDLKGLKDVKI